MITLDRYLKIRNIIHNFLKLLRERQDKIQEL